ncbi:Uncharacterised protein [Vibrio cholerae]|nr:Uncharacterised protein [Vibrio cholerae]CSD22351.1 Uncharacterised protein [Vibrio cholerae]CSE02794.1 Uncharacterised protein [Vibrio cholerae]CSH95845.1 Uncharacterised protein [Vibrio cholerae]
MELCADNLAYFAPLATLFLVAWYRSSAQPEDSPLPRSEVNETPLH